MVQSLVQNDADPSSGPRTQADPDEDWGRMVGFVVLVVVVFAARSRNLGDILRGR